MSSVYEVTGNLLELQALMEEDIDPQVLADTMEAVKGEYDFKMESCCKVVKNLEASRDAKKNEAKRLTDAAKVLDNNIERLKKLMFDSMKATGTNKIKGQLFTVAIQKNGGKIPVIVDVDTADLPDELVTIVEKPNLEAIREVLEKGESNLAHFGERGESLRIN